MATINGTIKRLVNDKGFGFIRGKLGKHAAKPQCVFAKHGSYPVIARRGRIAFIEDEINHFKDRGQTRGSVRAVLGRMREWFQRNF